MLAMQVIHEKYVVDLKNRGPTSAVTPNDDGTTTTVLEFDGTRTTVRMSAQEATHFGVAHVQGAAVANVAMHQKRGAHVPVAPLPGNGAGPLKL